VFDALISKRPYKRAWTTEEALRVIQKSSGSHFDPIVIDALNASWGQFLEIQKEFATPATPRSGRVGARVGTSHFRIPGDT